MNTYVVNGGGMSLFVDGQLYTVESSHIRFDQIRDAARAGEWQEAIDQIPLIGAITKYVTTEIGVGKITVDAESHKVLFDGHPLHNYLVDKLFKMMEQNHDVLPLVKFLNNLMRNPSNKAVQELYRWIESNGMTISEDGYLYAYKRVQDDYTSFYDGKTKNPVGGYVEMPRWQVDDRSHNTCSAGLHFCSQAYLPHYAGGQGRVLLLKIDPADVVSIPTDYKNAKGRACRYFIESELKGESRDRVETEDVITARVVTVDVEDINTSTNFQRGYKVGYKAGRGKQKNEYRDHTPVDKDDKLFTDGYLAGYKDGRDRSPAKH